MANKITKTCSFCSQKFSMTYFAATTEEEATDVCFKCWNKNVLSHYTSTRDVLKSNTPSVPMRSTTWPIKTDTTSPIDRLLSGIEPLAVLAKKAKDRKRAKKAKRELEKDKKKGVKTHSTRSPYLTHLGETHTLNGKQKSQVDKLVTSLKSYGI